MRVNLSLSTSLKYFHHLREILTFHQSQISQLPYQTIIKFDFGSENNQAPIRELMKTTPLPSTDCCNYHRYHFYKLYHRSYGLDLPTFCHSYLYRSQAGQHSINFEDIYLCYMLCSMHNENKAITGILKSTHVNRSHLYTPRCFWSWRILDYENKYLEFSCNFRIFEYMNFLVWSFKKVTYYSKSNYWKILENLVHSSW